MESIKITLETLYDILRNEKKRDDLQKLDSSFFVDVVTYLQEKNALLNSRRQESDIFASGERDKLDYELRSIKRILKEIYEKREKKIIDIALNKSKTGSDIIDTSAMLREERLFYEEILRTLDTYRLGIMQKLFRAELPDVTMPSLWRSSPKPVETMSTHQTPIASYESEETAEEPEEHTTAEASGEHTEKVSTMVAKEKSNVSVASLTVSSSLNASSFIKVKFIHATPKFIWKDMKEYGPFDPGEFTEIYPEVAELLVRKGRAEKV